jgi:hypothetical protein
MVHGLETLKRLNGERKPNGGNGHKLKVPDGIANSPGAIRAWANRSWTERELGGRASEIGEKHPTRENGKAETGTIPLSWAPPGCAFENKQVRTSERLA